MAVFVNGDLIYINTNLQVEDKWCGEFVITKLRNSIGTAVMYGTYSDGKVLTAQNFCDDLIIEVLKKDKKLRITLKGFGKQERKKILEKIFTIVEN